jgi:hypothetical protein
VYDTVVLTPAAALPCNSGVPVVVAPAQLIVERAAVGLPQPSYHNVPFHHCKQFTVVL